MSDTIKSDHCCVHLSGTILYVRQVLTDSPQPSQPAPFAPSLPDCCLQRAVSALCKASQRRPWPSRGDWTKTCFQHHSYRCYKSIWRPGIESWKFKIKNPSMIWKPTRCVKTVTPRTILQSGVSCDRCDLLPHSSGSVYSNKVSKVHDTKRI